MKKYIKNLNISYKIIQIDSITKIKNIKGIIVFCANHSSVSMELIEALSYKYPFIAAKSAGTKEIISESLLFDRNILALVEKIENLKEIKFSKIIHSYNINYWKEEFIKNLNLLNSNIFISEKKKSFSPFVSLCIAYYNHGKYLAQCLESVNHLKYLDKEVIIINDGSNDQLSIDVFNKMKEKYKDFIFITKENQGPALTRNYAANFAKGEYLLFMDSDNIAKVNMIDEFVKGIYSSSCDCLTCYFDQFNSEDELGINRTYALVGPSLEMGVFINCFGDSNFFIKKSIFLEIGGFYKKRVVTEDWQFLCNLTLKGYKMDVIAESLFYYRIVPNSNVNFGSEYLKQQIILETYCKELPDYIYHIFNSLCRPSFEKRSIKFLIKKLLNKINFLK